MGKERYLSFREIEGFLPCGQEVQEKGALSCAPLIPEPSAH